MKNTLLFLLFFSLSLLAHYASGFYSWHYVSFLLDNFGLNKAYALPFLVFLEVAKHLFLAYWLTGVFCQESPRLVNAYTGIGTVLLYSFSIICALQGSGLHSQQKFDKKAKITQDFAQKSQTIQQKYEGQIRQYETQIKSLNALQATRQARNIYWGLDSTDKAQLAFAQTQIRQIHQEKNKELTKLESLEIGQIKENTQVSQKAEIAQLYLSGIIEGILLIFSTASTFFLKSLKLGEKIRQLLLGSNRLESEVKLNFSQTNNFYTKIEIPEGYEPILAQIYARSNQPGFTHNQLIKELDMDKSKYYKIKEWLPVYELIEKNKVGNEF